MKKAELIKIIKILITQEFAKEEKNLDELSNSLFELITSVEVDE